MLGPPQLAEPFMRALEKSRRIGALEGKLEKREVREEEKGATVVLCVVVL